MKSEVARILEQIREEDASARCAMEGFAQGTSRHAFITAKMERIGELAVEIEKLVPGQAWMLITDTLTQGTEL